MKDGIIFSKYIKQDENDLVEICFRTGFMGEDLRINGKFHDEKLFGLLFCLYFPFYETDNCFVAYDTVKQKTVGYIIGSMDSLGHYKKFKKLMLPRIVKRLFTYTCFRYPLDFIQVLKWNTIDTHDHDGEEINKDYPAELHTNLLPEYHRMGIGAELMGIFLDHMKSKGVGGVHLGTSNYNVKALPFYKKMGFVELKRTKQNFWGGVTNQESVIMGKIL